VPKKGNSCTTELLKIIEIVKLPLLYAKDMPSMEEIVLKINLSSCLWKLSFDVSLTS